MYNRIAFDNNISKTDFLKGETMKKNLFGTLGQYIKGNVFIVVLTIATVAAGVLSFRTIKDINNRLDNQTIQPPAQMEEPAQPPQEEAPAQDVQNQAENVPLKPKATTTPKPQATPTPEAEQEAATKAEGVEVTEPTDFFVLPVDNKIVAAFSGDELVYNITMGDWRTHNGIDIKATKDTAVKACCDGVVRKVYNDGMLGWVVEIETEDFATRYCGLDEKVFVKTGDKVTQGQTVGKVGEIPLETAADSHLHLEIVKNGSYQNPDDYLKR